MGRRVDALKQLAHETRTQHGFPIKPEQYAMAELQDRVEELQATVERQGRTLQALLDGKRPVVPL
jgi:hypothetical protein